MKNALITMLVLCIAVSGFAQGKKKTFTECGSVSKYYALYGDVITFKCDTVVLLSLTAYGRLDSSYVELHKLSGRMATVTDSLTVASKKLYEAKAIEYTALSNNFADFRRATTNHLDSVNKDMAVIKKDMAAANVQLDSAYKHIVKSQNLVKREKRKIWWRNAGYIGVGLALGLLVAILK
jgi:hypothetical protein